MKETIDILAAPGNKSDKAEKEFEFKNIHHFGQTYQKLKTH